MSMSSKAIVPVSILPRSDLPASLARLVLDHIRDHDLQPGDRLPSLDSLARRFTVATPTMREALRRLQATGEVELRQGSGTYVGRGRDRLVLANPNVESLDFRGLVHLLNARIIVEPHLTTLAAERANDADIAELEHLLQDTERQLFPSGAGVNRVNNSFHLAIARTAREPVLAQIDEALLELYGSGYCVSFHPIRGRPRDLHDHTGILNAIRARDPVLASARMLQHLLDSRADVEQRIAETLDSASATTPIAVEGAGGSG